MSHYNAGSRSRPDGLGSAGNVWRMIDGTTNGLNGSRIGFRGVEDLGGGLKGGFVLEMGVLADTGALGQGGSGFGRQGFVYLSHATLGEVRLGRQYILEDAVMSYTNPFGNALVDNPSTSVTNRGRNIPLWLNAPRADNVAQYQTPSLGGFTVAGQIAPGEGTADRFHGLRLAYNAGPLNAGVSYEWNKPRAGGDDTNKSLTIGANYDFGFVKPMFGIQRNKNLTTTSGNGAAVGLSNLVVATNTTTLTLKNLDGNTVGAEVPVGNAVVLGASYTWMKYKGTTGQSLSLGKGSLVAGYGFSKNTFVYAGVSTSTGDLKNYIAEKSVTQVGMRTAF